MLAWIVDRLTGALIEPITELGKAYIAREVSQAELEAQIRKAVEARLAQEAAWAARVVMAEAHSEDRLTRRWRPLVALGFAGAVLAQYILFPVLSAYLGAPEVRLDPELHKWVLAALNACIFGYMGFRSWEKRGRG